MNSEERKSFENRMIGTQEFTGYTPPKKKENNSVIKSENKPLEKPIKKSQIQNRKKH